MSDTNEIIPETAGGGVRWHIIVGLLSLLYGVLGTFFWTAVTLMTFFWQPFMKAVGMGDVAPPAGAGWNLAMSLVLVVLGIILAIGGAMILGRRARGASLLRFWAVTRLVMIVVGLGIGLVYMSEQVAFAMRMAEAQRDMYIERGGDPAKFPDTKPEDAERNARYQLVGFSVVVAAYPLFVAILLTSRRKRDDIESWKSLL